MASSGSKGYQIYTHAYRPVPQPPWPALSDASRRAERRLRALLLLIPIIDMDVLNGRAVTDKGLGDGQRRRINRSKATVKIIAAVHLRLPLPARGLSARHEATTQGSRHRSWAT